MTLIDKKTELHDFCIYKRKKNSFRGVWMSTIRNRGCFILFSEYVISSMIKMFPAEIFQGSNLLLHNCQACQLWTGQNKGIQKCIHLLVDKLCLTLNINVQRRDENTGFIYQN